MKKGSFLSGKNLGGDTAPTADAIRELNRQLTGKTAEPVPIENPAPPTAQPTVHPVVQPLVQEAVRERKVRITVDIPESLHEALKIYTFRNRTTMKDLFLEYVAELVAESK